MSELRILVFACTWCSSAAADLAGTTRLKMPADFTMLRVLCSGRVDPVHVLRALALGADGVMVSGCHPGDCHYTSGNLHAARRVAFLEAVLSALGLGGRLEMHHVSAAEGQRFREVLAGFRGRLAALGPSPLALAREALPVDRREAFRSLLLQIAAHLDAEVGDAAPLPAEVVADSYGEPRYDPEACMGCGGCFEVCPADNIELSDAVGLRTIAHRHSRCIDCKTCEEACPVEAITVEHGFDLGAFLSDRRLEAVSLALHACAACGRDTVPVRQLEHLARELEEKGQPAEASLLCESCRRRSYALDLRRHLGGAP